MCVKPRTPKAPKVATAPSPGSAEKTATTVGRSAEAQAASPEGTLGRFDLRVPPSFQIPRR